MEIASKGGFQFDLMYMEDKGTPISLGSIKSYIS